MQINDLPSSNTLASTDVLAKDTSGGTTQKISGSDLVTQIKLLGSLLGTGDVVNNLTSTATDKPLSAGMGKELDTKISGHGTYDLLVSSTIDGWSDEITVTSLSQYRYIRISTGQNSEIGSTMIPIDIFKTYTEVYAACGLNFDNNGTNIIAYACYRSDTSIKVYQTQNFTTKVYGIK